MRILWSNCIVLFISEELTLMYLSDKPLLTPREQLAAKIILDKEVTRLFGVQTRFEANYQVCFAVLHGMDAGC